MIGAGNACIYLKPCGLVFSNLILADRPVTDKRFRKHAAFECASEGQWRQQQRRLTELGSQPIKLCFAKQRALVKRGLAADFF